MKKHRNFQKRIYIEDGTYFITSNTFNWIPYFKEPIFCDLFAFGSEAFTIIAIHKKIFKLMQAQARRVENLRLCKKLKDFYLYAWVLIYNHFHLLIRPGEEFDISKVMQFLKRHISRDINCIIGYNKFDQPTSEGGIRESRLRGSNYEKFEQPIIEYNQKLKSLQSKFQQKYPNGHPFPKFQWHESFRDHYIRNDDDFDNHWEYIKRNLEKHNLPQNWPYIFLNDEYEDLIDDCL